MPQRVVPACWLRFSRLRHATRSLAAAAALALGCAGAALAQEQGRSDILIDAHALTHAARIVAGPDGRTLLVPGDAAYAVGSALTPLDPAGSLPEQLLRVLRPGALPLRHPATGAPLGQEARAIGTARLRQAESQTQPAVIDILSAREEVRVGDLLAPFP